MFYIYLIRNRPDLAFSQCSLTTKGSNTNET
jgi:hypothetical protein